MAPPSSAESSGALILNRYIIGYRRMSNYAYFGTYELCRKQLGLTSGSSEGRSLAQSIGASVISGKLPRTDG